MGKQEDEFVSHIHKEVKVQCSKPKDRSVGQFFIQIPKEVVRELRIEKGDMVVIDVPLKEKHKYAIRFKRLR